MRYGTFVGLAASIVLMAAPLQECGTMPEPPTEPPENCVGGGGGVNQSLIPNGDFNEGYIDENSPGQPGTVSQANYAPAPWGINSTPDFSTDQEINLNGEVQNRAGVGFQPSPTGGSFLGFRSLAGPNEGIYNTLTIADPTEEMTILFNYTEWTKTSLVIRTQDAPVRIQFRLEVNPRFDASRTGTLISEVENLDDTGGTQGVWEQRRITFIPADLGFPNPGDYLFYLGSADSAIATWAFVDGLVVNESREICEPTTTTTVVEPTTTVVEPTTTTTFLEPTTAPPVGN
jgi:hypothetical protein